MRIPCIGQRNKKARGIKACEKGATAIEFALILPPLVFLILGSIEFSLYLFVQSALEGATFAASRLGKTGYVANEMTREETIRASLDDRIGFFLNPDKIAITSKSYDDFSSVGKPEPFIDANHNGVRDSNENYTDANGNGVYDEDMGVSGAGDAGEVVVYTVTYPWQIMTPFIQDYLGKTSDISSKFIVKNEPY